MSITWKSYRGFENFDMTESDINEVTFKMKEISEKEFDKFINGYLLPHTCHSVYADIKKYNGWPAFVVLTDDMLNRDAEFSDVFAVRSGLPNGRASYLVRTEAMRYVYKPMIKEKINA